MLRLIPACLAAFAVLCLGAWAISQDVKPPATPQEPEKPTVDEARARAEMLSDVYVSSLRALHRHYFRDDAKQPVPSHVLEDVFFEQARRSKVEARWIAVNANAMSVDHEPKDEFEQLAARELSRGKNEFERVENGLYRRAEAITLFGSCLKCHAPAPLRPDVSRVAGLVVSIPVRE